MNRRVLVTGAAGFVGSWLVNELLSLGAHVMALVHHPDYQSEFYRSGDYNRVHIIQGNLEDVETLEYAINKYEVETIIHLAAQSLVGVAQRSPLQTFESNIRGTYNLLEACRRYPSLVKEIVIASSDKAYGTHDNLPYTEDMPLQGLSPYEVSKSCADLIAQSYVSTFDIPLVIARCGNIYGGGDLNWSRIIPHTIRACFMNRSPEIRSDGTFQRDYIYCKDVVEGYLCLAESLGNPQVRGQAFNFGPGRAYSVLEIVDSIQTLMGSSLQPMILNTAQGEIHDQWLDSTKAQRELDWVWKYSLEDGLKETIVWYRNFLESTS